MKWIRNNTESRGWIKARKAVQPRKEERGGVSRYSRCSVRERRWGMEPTVITVRDSRTVIGAFKSHHYWGGRLLPLRRRKKESLP
jgi:hypothetical protein